MGRDVASEGRETGLRRLIRRRDNPVEGPGSTNKQSSERPNGPAATSERDMWPEGESPTSVYLTQPDGVGPLLYTLEAERRSAVVLRPASEPGEGQQPDWADGQALEISWITDAALWTAATEVLSSLGEGCYLVASPRSCQRHQRRAHFRWAVELPVDLTWAHSGEPIVLQGMTADVSTGGLSISAPDPVETPVPFNVSVTLHLPADDPLVSTAEAVRTSEGGTRLHVRFIDLAERDQARLGALINSWAVERRRRSVAGA